MVLIPFRYRGKPHIAFVEKLIQAFPDTAVVALRANDKRPIRRFEKSLLWNRQTNDIRRLRETCKWFDAGLNVGFVLHKTGFWVLDLDATEGWPEAIDKAIEALDPPQVFTPSGGRHCYFSLPDSLANHPDLKAHVLHPIVGGKKLPLDLKLGGRPTLVVAPGSKRGDVQYLFNGKWKTPPVLDPRDILPTVDPLHRRAGVDFVRSQRPIRDRIWRAVSYLRLKAPVSVSGSGGAATLLGVCTHLTSYLNLPIDVALKLLVEPQGKSWNDRCVDGTTHSSFPWQKADLERALKRGASCTPQFGVYEAETIRRAVERDTKLKRVCEILLGMVDPRGDVVPVRDVYNAVLPVVELSTEECTITRLGRAMRNHGIQRVQMGPKRTWSLLIKGGAEALGDALRSSMGSDATT